MTEKLQGEQFPQSIKFDSAAYDQCDQIVVAVFSSSTGTIIETFVKVADEKYPNAAILTKNETDAQAIDLFFTSEKTKNMLGKYSMEIKRVVSGVQMPIFKTTLPMFNFSTSITV